MQLLDDLRFHAVTHGHKHHVPHSLPRLRTDTSGPEPKGFQGGAEAKLYSLFRSQSLGYAIPERREISERSADVTMRTVLEKRNMRVEQPGKEIHHIDVRIIAEAPGSRITRSLPSPHPRFKSRIVEDARIEIERPGRSGTGL